ncbi:hypothetical protein [Rhizobium binxianense]
MAMHKNVHSQFSEQMAFQKADNGKRAVSAESHRTMAWHFGPEKRLMANGHDASLHSCSTENPVLTITLERAEQFPAGRKVRATSTPAERPCQPSAFGVIALHYYKLKL